ncbi:PEBP-like protein [Trametopsis cervina]|nr:PEBP-like protein [Trametopsis cervina]
MTGYKYMLLAYLSADTHRHHGPPKTYRLFLRINGVLKVAQDRSTAEVVAAFRKAHIPEDIRLPFHPTTLLEVTFPQISGRAVPVHAGVQLPRNQTAGTPHFAVRGDISRNQRFVISAMDLDAPSHQNRSLSQVRHFLGGDFVRSTIARPTEQLVNITTPVSGWLQPAPSAGTGAHRYIFLLFHQPAGFDRQTFVTADTPITNFDISTFAQETGLGTPIGGTFIKVAHDTST